MGHSLEEGLPQEELRDLRSMSIQADQVRWVTRGPDADGFDAVVRGFAEDWRDWIEQVADCLIRHDWVPDGRISALNEGSYRAWLPGEWLETTAAAVWVARELEILGNWARARAEQVVGDELGELFASIDEGFAAQGLRFSSWSRALRELVDKVDEAGMECFPASDPPSWWSGPSEPAASPAHSLAAHPSQGRRGG